MSFAKGTDEVNEEVVKLSPTTTDGEQSPTNTSIGHDLDEKSDSSAIFKRVAPASWKRRASEFTPIRRILSALATDEGGFFASRTGTPPPARPWKTTLIRFGPLSGIFGMLLAVASLVASLGILAGSDRMPVADWTAPPSTYLAIFTAIANLSIRYAAINGVVIAWWLRAAKGSTLAKLHYDWRSGTSLFGALTAGRNSGLLSLACLCSTLVVIDGPLLQRSSTVVTRPFDHIPVPLNITMAPEIPTGFTGFWNIGGPLPFVPAFNDTVPTGDGSTISNFIMPAATDFIQASIVNQWLSSTALSGVVHGCSGICSVRIQAPAFFPTSCSTHVLPANYREYVEQAKLSEDGQGAFPIDKTGMFIATNLAVHEREEINIVTGYAHTTDCVGNISWTACTYEPAIGAYDVIVEAGLVQTDSLGAPTMVAVANNSAVEKLTRGVHRSTLAGLVQLMFANWVSTVDFYQGKDGQMWVVDKLSLGALQFTLPNGQKCANSYRDPHDEVYQSLNRLGFYTGALAASENASYAASRMDAGLSVHSTATGYRIGPHNVFHTDYWFFLVAALVDLVCITLVAPTYWGWWRLGRPLSFSPLELAKAFDSPMLANVNSNYSSRDIAVAVGDGRARYGATIGDSMGGSARLGFGDPKLVCQPRKDQQFSV